MAAPAGAALATRLAQEGMEVVVFERWPAPRWRASGVYSTVLTRRHLLDLGISAERVAALIRPIDRMEVISLRGPRCELHYEAPFACGLDRVRLERAMLDRASGAGALVLEGHGVRTIERRRGDWQLGVSGSSTPVTWRARFLAGADGPNSAVARSIGLSRPVRRLRHAGLTFHKRDAGARAEGVPTGASMILGNGWYCGLAPVPGGRVNIGIVIGEGDLRRRLSESADPGQMVHAMAASLPAEARRTLGGEMTDAIQVALPLAHRVSSRAGPGFALVGDAAGFVDPLTGEGIHRALVSAELAADMVVRARAGRIDAWEAYDKRLAATFGEKDVLSWMLQAFLSHPALMDHALRRLASRNALRSTLGSVLADLSPAREALHPRFIVGLLRP